MPIIPNNAIISNLTIKTPITLQVQIPKSVQQYILSKLGQGNIASGSAKVSFFFCDTTNLQCSNPQEGVAVELNVSQNGNWQYVVTFSTFYFSNPVFLKFDAFPQGQEQDVTFNILLNGSLVSISANGKLLVQTDTLKPVGSIRQIEGLNGFYDASGNLVSYDNNIYENVTTVQGIDVNQLLNIIIPLAIVAFAVSLIPKIIQKIKS